MPGSVRKVLATETWGSCMVSSWTDMSKGFDEESFLTTGFDVAGRLEKP
jgi:hypothetical protein